MKYCVYILKSLHTGKHYFGHTQDLEERIDRHNQGRAPATRGKGTWKLIYHEVFVSTAKAMAREKFFKSYPGWRWLKNEGIT
ncbi:MAG: GIY-YIG nuclease family protein [Bacteroidota bacterium]